eukprot:6193213-Pleurochrysis_carterae.AAC.1
MAERLGRLIIRFLPAVLAGEGRALLRELVDKKVLGNESRVIEETMRLVKMAHTPFPVSAVNKHQGKKGKRRRSGGILAQGRLSRRPSSRATAVRAPKRAVVLQRHLPLHPRQDEPRGPVTGIRASPDLDPTRSTKTNNK